MEIAGFGGSNSAIIVEGYPSTSGTHGTQNGEAATNGSATNGEVAANGITANGTVETNGITTNGTETAVNGTATNGIVATNGTATNGIAAVNGTANGTNGDNIATDPQRLFVLSAKSEKSLTSYLTDFDEYLDEVPETSDFFRDLSYTLGQRRTHYPYRVTAVADSVATLQEKLSAAKPSRIKDQTIAFAFTGQGAQ